MKQCSYSNQDVLKPLMRMHWSHLSMKK